MKPIAYLAAVGCMLLITVPVQAHEVPNIKHSHAFEQTGYGKYRQGHYVDGPQGSIILWSARTQNSPQSRSTVRFARPEPITKAPSNPFRKYSVKTKPATNYGKEEKKDYGK